MKKSLFFLLFAVAVASASSRAAIEKDLGQALAYFRVTDAKTDLTAVLDLIAHRPAFVLDLRALVADENFASAVRNALAQKPGAHAVRLVLINASTSPSVVAALDQDFIDVLTIGPQSPAIKPDVAVHVSEGDDRKAYAALAAGTPVEKLITDSTDKRRYDEAKLVHDHANGVAADADLPADADDDSVSTEPETAKKNTETEKKAEPPVIDLVLERAVQMHRSLLATKRL